MAYRNYYDYGTSPRKLDPTPQYKKSSKNPKTKSKKIRKAKNKKLELKKQKRKIMLYLAIFSIVLFSISYRYSLINEQFNNVQKSKKELVSIQKENEQIKINIENNINLTNIEKLARERLGMKKLDKSQIIYITLDKQDYIETSKEPINNKNNNIIGKILDLFK